MSVQLAPTPVFRANDNNGNPLFLGQLFSYVAGTTTPQATWVDSTQTTQNTNPVILNARGEANVWLQTSLTYKLVLQDASGNLIWSVDNVPGNSAIFAQTPAEQTAGVVPVNYSYPPYDIRRYGADSTGLTASDTALTSALAVCGALGGTILFPPGRYTFANQYSLSQRQNIVFQGAGSCTSAVAGATTLIYSGVASPWFTARLSNGISWRNLSLQHSNSGFTGTYIKYGAIAGNPAAYGSLIDCVVGCGVSLTTHLDLDQTIDCTFQRCLFLDGNPSVKGQQVSSFSIAISFKDCSWQGSGQNPIAFCGGSWSFDSCDFEPLANGYVGAIGTISTTPCKGLAIRNCWFGDATAGNGTWITFFGSGFTMSGCWMGGNSGAELISLNNCQGVSITGNEFDGCAVAIGFDTATIGGVMIVGNYFTTACTAIWGTTAVPTGLLCNPNATQANPSGPIAPPAGATITGFGTPTGGSIVANYAGGSATLLQTSETVAQVLLILQQYGLIGS